MADSKSRDQMGLSMVCDAMAPLRFLTSHLIITHLLNVLEDIPDRRNGYTENQNLSEYSRYQ